MYKVQSLFVVVILLTFGLSTAEDEVEEGFVRWGDMILTIEQSRFYVDDPIKRNGLENPIFRWPKGLIPIVFDPKFNETHKKLIRQAAKHISDNTCVKFNFNADTQKHPNYVQIVKYERRACRSKIGFLNRGKQEMLLTSDYCKKGNIVHEFLHTLGLLHMHTASERNKFVKIRHKNIIPGYQNEFKKTMQQVSMFNTPYDYLSMTHYGQFAHSIDRKTKKTIIPVNKDPKIAKAMGQRKGLSVGDIQRINRMYGCPKVQKDFIASDEGEDNDGEDEDPLVVVEHPHQVTGDIPEPEG